MKKDWIECTLGEVCEVNMGQSPPSSTYNTDGIGMPFFQGKAEFTDLHPIVKKWCSAPKKIANKKDILLSVRAPVGSTNIADQECSIGRGLAAITYKYENMFIWYYLKSIETNLDSQGTGTTFKAISGTILKSQIIGLPPLVEQKAIVKKIEELFSSLDSGIADLKKAQDQLVIYRQAVLKKAFEGEYPQKKIIEIADVNTGATPKRGNSDFWEDGSIPWVTSTVVNNDFVNEPSELITENAIKKTNCKLITKGSLLVAMYGEGKTRGKCSELNIDAATNQALAAITLLEDNKDSKKFLKLFLLKNYEEIRLLSSGGVQPNLNLTIVKNTIIPFPSLKEQHQIVQEIESRLSVCDKVEKDIADSLEKAQALRQSILKKAFEGKLLSEGDIATCKADAAYEPASVLLEKIKAEKKKK